MAGVGVREDRQHGGNTGYADEPSTYYSWDNTVDNHAALIEGDMIAIGDKHVLLGASVIERIETGDGVTSLHVPGVWQGGPEGSEAP